MSNWKQPQEYGVSSGLKSPTIASILFRNKTRMQSTVNLKPSHTRLFILLSICIKFKT